MGTAAEHWARAEAVADTTRRLVVTLNSSGIGLVFTVAGWLKSQGMPAQWAVFPVMLFVIGLLFTAASLFSAKDRELERFKEAKAGRDPYDIKFPWYRHSFTLDLASIVAFSFGAVLGLSCLAGASHG